jgi:hypothetical protein
MGFLLLLVIQPKPSNSRDPDIFGGTLFNFEKGMFQYQFALHGDLLLSAFIGAEPRNGRKVPIDENLLAIDAVLP